MTQAIGDFLPAAIGIAISPIPIVAVTLMLGSARGRANGPAFLVGWIAGLLIAGTALLFLIGAVGASDSGQPAAWVSWLKLAIGLGLVLLAVKQFRARPRGDEEPETPGWMQAIDTFRPAKAAGAGVVLSSINPKNVVLLLAGMAAIAESGLPPDEQAIALAAFTVIASLGAAAPVVLSFALGDRSADLLDGLRGWMTRNGAVVMVVILLVLGAKLVGDAIAGFGA
jgi:threonine/homoserine/homoserine lactone efflux protein